MLFNTLQKFSFGKNQKGEFYSLPQLEKEGIADISKLPVSIRIILESVLRNVDGKKVTKEDVATLAKWQPNAPRKREIPFVVARVLLQDFTGVPLVVDLAAMRSAVQRLDKNPSLIEPLVPLDLVVDHSIQMDFTRVPDAIKFNMRMEFKRNQARYKFLKWGNQAFKTFNIVPPGIGICHQVNLEYLSKCVWERNGVYFFDTLVGTDSHTTMVNGLGVLGWGVGGIEAEAGMLGQPIYILTPDVVGFHMSGQLCPGVTATDLVLHCTEILRKAKVVGKFVEFHGEGAASLSVADRATIANMAPEYGATIGFFPFDEKSCTYLRNTGRSEAHIEMVKNYHQAQELFGMPRKGQCHYSLTLDLDLTHVQSSISGPKRPQDRINLNNLKDQFLSLLQSPAEQNGYAKSSEEIKKRYPVSVGIPTDSLAKSIAGGGQQASETVPIPVNGDSTSKANTSALTEYEMINNRPTPDRIPNLPNQITDPSFTDLGHGDVVIAAITSCTNTSNPHVMIAAGLLAKKAVARGLSVSSRVKTSLSPGSRVVMDYYQKTGLQTYLDALGFYLSGYGCATCIGNSGPLDPNLEDVINKNDVIAASVLSGNRNFEARVHQSIKANFLMSPPLVVAFALAGRVDIDLTTESLGKDQNGQDVFLRDIWPTTQEIEHLLATANDPQVYRRLYGNFTGQVPLWDEISTSPGLTYEWDRKSTYIQEPPYFQDFKMNPGKPHDIKAARALAIFGNSITTDHISPAGAIKPNSPAGRYLQEHGVKIEDFNSYGARRGNHDVMVRGTFANVRIRNLMVPDVEGGVTIHQPSGKQMSIYDAAQLYQRQEVPLLVFAGQEYGTGSSRDWAAKGTKLLGVKAVIAQSFERIHRSNLIGMGVLPCQFKDGINVKILKLNGSEVFDLTNIKDNLKAGKEILLTIHRPNGAIEKIPIIARIDTPIEVEYYQHDGILPYMLRQIAQG